MGPIKDALRKAFIPALLGEKEINDDLRSLCAYSVKQAGLGIRNPVEAASSLLTTSVTATSVLVDSLLGQTDLDLVSH